MKDRIITVAFLLAGAFAGTAQEYSFTPDILEPTASEDFAIGTGLELALSGEVTGREFFDFSYSSEHFGFIAAASFHQDDDYSPDIANTPNGTLFGSYFLMDQGGMVFRGLDMELTIGRMEHHDVIDSPYSLFVSSKRNPALIANFRYENDFAFYETRWIQLNESSEVDTPAFPNGYPDRGAQIKTYGVKIGTMRFGFQDAAVYTGRSFDLEYFVSPMPNYLIQYVKGTDGRPWSTGVNENDIMGFFWDWQPNDDTYYDVQVLVDDFSLFGLFDTSNNPWKAAYSLGGRWDTDIGRFSFHHALATKYTFAATNDTDSDQIYSYTYYPDTRFNISDSEYQSISIEDNMIGYYNGENNMAFRLDYDASWFGYDIASNLELVLSGPKSPCNSWHEATTYRDDPGTKLFDYSAIEKKIVLSAQVSRRLGDFIAFTNLRAGVAFNALELQPAISGEEGTVNTDIWIWRPGDDTDYILSISLGLRYDFPVMDTLRKE